ncbi:mitochondrial F1-F0 ATP synthase subunit F of fungi-domain-containing protein [Mycena rebaudengoi]|nr:mitochondrial F1-F0 ATP synthase subunit F of fungi-domain-containing protein [Mycena rebaudengoi]
MHASIARRAMHGLVPPKIATPKLVSGEGNGGLGPLVEFYSKLPKGRAPVPAFQGIKGRYFSGKNASAGPVLVIIGGLFLIGYTMDYQLHLKHHKNNAH